MEHFSYLAIALAPVAVMLVICLFDKNSRDFWRAPNVLLGVGLAALAYLAIDTLAVARDWWAFRPDFILGPTIYGQPVENIVIFITSGFMLLQIAHIMRRKFMGTLSPKAGLVAATLSAAGVVVVLAITAVVSKTPFWQQESMLVIAAVLFGVMTLACLTPLVRQKWYWLYSIVWVFTAISFAFIFENLGGIGAYDYNPLHTSGVFLPLLNITPEDILFSYGLFHLYVVVAEMLKRDRKAH